MIDRTPAERSDLEALRSAYRDKFESWATEVDRLRNLRCAGESGGLAEAKADVDLAENEYRNSRDRLATKLHESTREKMPAL